MKKSLWNLGALRCGNFMEPFKSGDVEKGPIIYFLKQVVSLPGIALG